MPRIKCKFLRAPYAGAGQKPMEGPRVSFFAGLSAIAVLALGALFWRLAPAFVSGERKVGQYRAGGAGARRGRLPLVGGPAVLLGVAAAAGAAGSQATLICVVAAAAFFLSGLADDLLKARRGNGLSERASLLAAVLSSAWASGWLLAVDRTTDAFALANWIDNSVLLAGWYFLLILAIALGAGFSDGIDGLAAGLGLIGFSALVLAGSGRAAEVAGLVGAGLIGFMLLNLPSRGRRRLALIYLGDSGALLIGALLAAAAIVAGYDLLLPLLAAVWVLEGSSSLIQAKLLVPLYRRYRRLGGRDHRTKPYQQFRLPFIATPLHHHLDICGLGRFRTVLLLWLLQVLFSALAAIAIAGLPAWAGLLLAGGGGILTWSAVASLRPARIEVMRSGDRHSLVLRHGRWRFLSVERARLEIPPDRPELAETSGGQWLDPLSAAAEWDRLRERVLR